MIEAKMKVVVDMVLAMMLLRKRGACLLGEVWRGQVMGSQRGVAASRHCPCAAEREGKQASLSSSVARGASCH